METVDIPCLHCGKPCPTPKGFMRFADRLKDDRVVCFCSKKCNMAWIAEEGRRGQEQGLRDLIDKLQKENKSC